MSLSLVPYLTYSVGVPRALYVRFPYGNPYGEPGDAATQRSILQAVLHWLFEAKAHNQMARIAVAWRRPRRHAVS